MLNSRKLGSILTLGVLIAFFTLTGCESEVGITSIGSSDTADDSSEGAGDGDETPDDDGVDPDGDDEGGDEEEPAPDPSESASPSPSPSPSASSSTQWSLSTYIKSIQDHGIANLISGINAAGEEVTYQLSVGTAADDGEYVSTEARDSANDNWGEAYCGSGEYVYKIEMEKSTWGTYPAATYLKVYCKNAQTGADGESDGSGVNTSSSNSSKECGDGYMITGFYAGHDRYVKNLKLRCTDMELDTSTGTITTGETSTGNWILDRDIENNDEYQSLECGSGQVLVGIKTQYDKTGNEDEAAFTYLRPRCATLSSTAVSSD